MFNQQNTAGYTDEQLARLNDELERRQEGIEDPTERADIEHAFSDMLDVFLERHPD